MTVLGFSHTLAAGKTDRMRELLGLAPAPDRWAELRWLAGIDERVLWATLAAVLLMGLWGAFVGWRCRDQTDD